MGAIGFTDPQLLIVSGLGGEIVEGSSVQQTKIFFGELAFLSGEPNHYIKIPTGALVMLLEQTV